jgi:hypothetical protein
MKALLMHVIFTCALAASMLAQPPAPKTVPAGNTQEAQPAKSQDGPALYKLNYVIYELEDGKRINERDYTMLVRVGDRSSGRMGLRVPVSLEENKIEYLDVGLSLACSLREQNGKVLADFTIVISSLAPPNNEVPHTGGSPVVRNFNQNINTILLPGKPMLLLSSDDLASKKRTQAEVTATRLD